MKNISYEIGNESLLSEIENLWKSLNDIHNDKTLCFKEHFENMTFEMRKEDLLKQAQKGELSIILVRNIDNKVIGYCVSSLVNRIGEIESICIDKEYRKRGIGDILMEKALHWIENKKPNKIFVMVAVGNEEVYGFYKKYGFYPRITKLEMKIGK